MALLAVSLPVTGLTVRTRLSALSGENPGCKRLAMQRARCCSSEQAGQADGTQGSEFKLTFISGPSSPPRGRFTPDHAMGLVLWAATGGPSTGALAPAGDDPFRAGSGLSQPEAGTTPPVSRSPRRKSVMGFTCNRCGHRTLRRVNRDAYETGTMFAQCGGCSVFHKIIDNLNIYHELDGPLSHPEDVAEGAIQLPFSKFFDE
eukprot:jgi/Mesvir1/22864/Mv20111-RA.1